MRIQVLSDLHLEFGPFTPPDVGADVIVLAGDIHVGVKGVEWAAETFPNQPVVYVPGNHEYYRSGLPRMTEKMRRCAEGTSVRLLDMESVELDGVRFLGCTLWTDFELDGNAHVAGAFAALHMSDFSLVRVSPSYRRLQPPDTIVFHRQARLWLQKSLSLGDPSRTVVVTHHAPSPVSIDVRFDDSPLNAAYASNLEDLLEEAGPVHWIHGHVHACKDYKVGAARVICNPRGYGDTDVDGFDPGKTFDL